MILNRHNNHQVSRFNVTYLMAIFTVILAFFSLTQGNYTITLSQILQACQSWFQPDMAIDATIQQILWSIRLPRILLALSVGAVLALSGAVLQGVFQNPLVDPHVIGVSSGAAFGGTLAILLSLPLVVQWSLTFVFGLSALMMIFLFALLFGQKNRLVLVLCGVILSGFFSALVSLMQYLSDTEEKLPNIVFWLLGSFSLASWQQVLFFLLPASIACITILMLRWRLNVLSLGDRDAQLLGISVNRTRWLILLLCALLIAAQVSVSGCIGWVGLVIPHLARMLVGVNHCRLLPASMWMGSGFMLLVDNIARLLTASEIPLGIITALVGAPAFLFIMLKKRKQLGF